MEYDFGPISVTIPDRFRDDTVYTFADPEEEQTVDVTIADTPDSSAEWLVTEKSGRLSRVYEPDIAFGPIETIATAAGPAATVFAQPSPSDPTRLYYAAIAGAPACEIDWTTASSDRYAFNRIVASVRRFPFSSARSPAGQGFESRAAGLFRIDVPIGYSSPAAFRFSSGTASLQCFIESARYWAVPSGEEIVYLDEGRLVLAQTEGPEEVEVDGGRGRGPNGLWVFDQYDGANVLVERHAVRQVALDFGPPIHFRVRGIARSADWADLAETWRDLLASVRRVDPA